MSITPLTFRTGRSLSKWCRLAISPYTDCSEKMSQACAATTRRYTAPPLSRRPSGQQNLPTVLHFGHPFGTGNRFAVFAQVPIQQNEERNGFCHDRTVVRNGKQTLADRNGFGPVFIFPVPVVIVTDEALVVIINPLTIPPPAGFRQCIGKGKKQPFVLRELFKPRP